MKTEIIKIPAPGNLPATLANVKFEIEKEKGTLIGNEKKGTITSCAFIKDDIQGEYLLDGIEIVIKIVKKPALVPFHLIQKEIIDVFKKCAVD